MTYKEVAERIKNIRYGRLGTIEFDFEYPTAIFDGAITITIAEPTDVLLVGCERPAAQWIALNYSFLLPVSLWQA